MPATLVIMLIYGVLAQYRKCGYKKHLYGSIACKIVEGKIMAHCKNTEEGFYLRV